MKKFLVCILIIIMIFSSGCDVLIETLEEFTDEQINGIQSTTAKPKIETNTPADSLYYDIPSLPNMDFSNLDLFEDGYQIVEFDHAPDGDTAIFLISGSYLKTRFLGVDTKEMSTDSGIPELWAPQAAEFTNDMLKNANEIILELDSSSDIFDNYERLLAWVWVDGVLLNYLLAVQGFADVKYLYDDYKYNDYLLDAEYIAQNQNKGIWGSDEPYYNPNKIILSEIANEYEYNYISINEARNMPEGSTITIKGIITNKIQNNAFIQDETGGIYLYTKNRSYTALSVGSMIEIKGTISDYNGFLELTDFDDNDIRILSQSDSLAPEIINLSQIGENLESQYVMVEGAEITYVDYKSGENGYSIFIKQGTDTGEIRIDKYLESYPDPESLVIGSIVDVIGNISQHYDSYQIMIPDENAINYR